MRTAWGRAVAAVALVCLAGLFWAAAPAGAAEPKFTAFDIVRSEDGVFLDYTLNVELPRGAEEALDKAVPLYFIAEASIFRDRWYWRDRRVANAVRVWRVVYQPLTATYRVTFGGLSQNHASRVEALAAISHGLRWKVAEAGQLDDGSGHYLEFSFKLDTSQLPRPMQIGISGQPDWALSTERTQRIN